MTFTSDTGGEVSDRILYQKLVNPDYEVLNQEMEGDTLTRVVVEAEGERVTYTRQD